MNIMEVSMIGVLIAVAIINLIILSKLVLLEIEIRKQNSEYEKAKNKYILDLEVDYVKNQTR
jgi:Tfp pilus assembly protein PilV